MDNINDYLTVSEVASIVGITTQAVYKQLHNQLQPYVIKVGNKIMLKNTVIKEYYKKSLPTKLVTNTTMVANKDQHTYQPESTDFNEIIKTLNQQLKEKDNQIKDLLTKQDNLQEELNKQNEHTRQQSIKLISLIEQVNQLQQNNQVLLAQTNQKQLNTNGETIADKQTSDKKPWWKRNK